MAIADRRAETIWEGPVAEGSGTLALASSHAASLPVTWASRVERPDGRTSPEELLAAAHSSCYSMALAAALGRAGHAPERLHVTAVVSLEPRRGGGFEVLTSALEVRARVPGLDAAGFGELADAAEKGCPISNAIRGNVTITLDATLEG